MNQVRVMFNPFLPELKIYINDMEPGRFSALSRYVHLPFFAWNDAILDEIFREVNDSFCIEFQSCQFECEIMEQIARDFPHCLQMVTKQTEIEVFLQQRFASLKDLAGTYLEKENIDIRVYSEGGELGQAVGEVLIESGLFDDVDGMIESELFPLCNLRYFVGDGVNLNNSEKGLHIYICDGLVDDDIVRALKQESKTVFIFELGLSTAFTRKEDNVYIYSIEADEIQDKLISVLEGSCMRTALKELCGKVLSLNALEKVRLTKEDTYKLEELLLVSKSYKLEYPQEMFIGRRNEIVVIELPGGFRNYQCRVECERNGVIETEEMTVYGKGAGIANLTIHVMEKNQWKIIENISIRVINMTLISELSLFPKNMFLSTGMEKKFQLMYKPDNAENTNEIQWTVSNPEVATVMQDGTVSGNTPGRCEITAFTEEASCSVQVEVQPSINDIILPAGFLSLSIGEKASFKYTLVPENCYERELVKVFNSNAHAIDFSGGYIIARNQGTSTLSIYTPNDRIKRTCVVEVKKKGLFG